MQKVDYDAIEPNIAEVDVAGAIVNVKWKCPVSGRVVCESNAAMKAAVSTAATASRSIKKTLIFEMTRSFNSFIKAAFGLTAWKVSAAATTALSQGAEKQIARPTFNTATEHEAVVNAFHQVEKKFKWDEDRELFIAAGS